MYRLLTPALALGLFSTPVLSQEAAKPGPEHARIGYFAGTWSYEATAQASPMGPGGKITGSETCRWFEGGFHLTCQGEMNSPRGAGKNGAVWAYDPVQQAYTYFAYNSFGEAFFIPGHVEGKTWTWMADFPAGPGATVKIRAIIIEESPTAYTYRVESSPDGSSWGLMEEGRATKRGG